MSDFRKTLPNARLSGHDSHTLLVRRNTYSAQKAEEVQEKSSNGKGMGLSLDFLGLMVITQLVMNWAARLTYTGETFLFIGYHIPAPTMQVYSAIASLPGTLKPLLGLISDVFPIMGYTKTPYAILFSITGLVAMYAIGFSPAEPTETGTGSFFFTGKKPEPKFSVGLLVTCITFGHLMMAMSEVFTSGLLAEKVNVALDENKDEGSPEGKEAQQRSNNLIGAFVVIGTVAGIGASFVCGRVLEATGPTTLFLIGAGLATSLPLWVIFRGFGDAKQTPEELAKVRKFLAGQREVVGLTLLLSAACLFMLFVPLAGGNGTLLNFFVAIGTSTVVITAFVLLLTPVIAKMLLGFFLITALSFNVNAAMMYFCLDNQYQFPGGPNFSKMFVTFWSPLVSSFASLVGCVLFRVLGMGWGLRNWELVTTIVLTPTLFLNIAWVYRWNISWGISDEVWILLENAVYGMVIGLQSLPFTWAIPRMCPLGLESSMMQLFGGVIFMAAIVAEDIGALLLQWWNVSPSGAFFEQDKFDNLAIVLLVKSAIACAASFAVIPMLPNVKLGENMIEPERLDAATHNSIWKRWMKKRAAAGTKGKA